MVGEPLGSLRDFRLLWFGGLLSSAGAQMSAIALPLLVLRHTGSPVEAGAVGTVSMGIMVVSMLPGGALADAVERRRLMIVCDAGSALLVGALATAVVLGRAPMPLILLVAGVGAVMGSVYTPALFGLLRSVVPAEQFGAATSRLQARSATARLIGPVVGGAAFAWHPAVPFLAEAAGLSGSTLCVVFVKTRSTAPRDKTAVFDRRQLTAGLSFVWRRPYLRTTLLVFGLGVNFAFSALIFMALTVASHSGRSGLGAGTVLSLSAAGSLVGSLLASRLTEGTGRGAVIPFTCWTCAVAAGVLAVDQGTVLMGVLIAFCMALASIASIAFLTTMISMAPADVTGRVQSAAGFVSSVVTPLGPVAGGGLLSGWAAAPSFAVLASMFAVCAAVVTWAPSTYHSGRTQGTAVRGTPTAAGWPAAVTPEEI
ncbi:MAG: MFS transporter [Catenulispora sp.]|nr:MFS transporter [Catenulispora sp.]